MTKRGTNGQTVLLYGITNVGPAVPQRVASVAGIMGRRDAHVVRLVDLRSGQQLPLQLPAGDGVLGAGEAGSGAVEFPGCRIRMHPSPPRRSCITPPARGRCSRDPAGRQMRPGSRCRRGKYDQSHAHHDQGGFTFFKRDWLTVTSNIWSHSGIHQEDEAHNVLRFTTSGGATIPQNPSACTRRMPTSTPGIATTSRSMRPASSMSSCGRSNTVMQ
jgi:hypothetical protein